MVAFFFRGGERCWNLEAPARRGGPLASVGAEARRPASTEPEVLIEVLLARCRVPARQNLLNGILFYAFLKPSCGFDAVTPPK